MAIISQLTHVSGELANRSVKDAIYSLSITKAYPCTIYEMFIDCTAIEGYNES